MKLNNLTFNRFNHSNTVLIISKYPVKNQPASHHGVATYTQNILTAISKQKKTKFVVLVENTFCQKPYQDGENILVIPTFSNGYFYPTQILKTIIIFSQIKLIHIHSEFITSGKPFQMALIIPLLVGLRVLGKRIYFTAHNVLDNFDFIAGHLGKSRNDLVLKILQYLMPWYYWLLTHLVNKVIVLDTSIEKRLAKIVTNNKLYLSPHWIHPKTISNQKQAYWRKEFEYDQNDFVIICFGFMTKYKGVDWLFNAIEYAHQQIGNKKIRLILAGGRAPSQTGKSHYEQFYKQLAEQVASSPNCILTGFIPESEIKRYFAVSDLVVLPYRGILGASGSWAQAVAYGKPFLLSQELVDYTLNKNVTDALNYSKSTKEDIVFTRNKHQFTKKLQKLINQPKILYKLATVSKQLAHSQSAQQRIKIEHKLLYTPQSDWISVQWNYVISKVATLPALLANH